MSIRRIAAAIVISILISIEVEGQKSFIDLGYPLTSKDFTGIIYAGYGYKIIGADLTNALYVKPEISLYNLDKTYTHWNLNINVGYRIRLVNPDMYLNHRFLWITEVGYGSLQGNSMYNDHAFYISAGIEHTNIVTGAINPRVPNSYIMIQYQKHSGAIQNDLSSGELLVLRFGFIILL